MSEHSTIEIPLQSQPHEQQQPHQQQQNYGEFGPPIMNRDEESLSNLEVKKKKGKENWLFVCHPLGKEGALEIIMKPYKHVVKHTTKLIRGMSATYQCTAHVSCPHSFKLVEKTLSDGVRWTLSELNAHSTTLAPKPRGIDPAIRVKVDELACLGASPLHILETLASSRELEGMDLPTRDQISNRIHGRESKKRKSQMAALKLQHQRDSEDQSTHPSYNGVEQHPSPAHGPQYIPQSMNVDASEQASLEMFGPHLLYHSIYYHEYGLGMIVSVPPPSPPLSVISCPLNPLHNQPTNFYSMSSSINIGSPSLASNIGSPYLASNNEMPVPILESMGLNPHISFPDSNQNPSVNGDNTYVSSLPSNSLEPSPHESVPFIAPSLPMIQGHADHYPSSSSSPLWTLLFLHTPPDENGFYMQCPLGCPDCVHGKVHLVVNRSMLLAGLMGAIDVAQVGLHQSPSHSKYWEQPEGHDHNDQNEFISSSQATSPLPAPGTSSDGGSNQDLSGLHLGG